MAAEPVGAELPVVVRPVGVRAELPVVVRPVGVRVARPAGVRVARPVPKAAAEWVQQGAPEVDPVERALQELQVEVMPAVQQRPRQVVVRVGTADMAVEAAPERRAA